jgi:F-type H+-transporting ATPase subunit b
MDFWTIILQIVNFLIFLAILHHILYRPVTDMMRRRKEEMESEREEAHELREEARELRDEARKREEELEEKRGAILDEAREEAESTRDEIIGDAREAGRKRLERFRRTMLRERAESLRGLADDLAEAVLAALRRVLEEAAPDPAGHALGRVETMLKEADAAALQEARKHLEEQGEPVRVRSASELGYEQKQRLHKAVADALELDEPDLRWETDPELLAGIELTAGSLQVRADWAHPVREAIREETDALAAQVESDAGREEASSEGESSGNEDAEDGGGEEEAADSAGSGTAGDGDGNPAGGGQA